MALGVLHPLFGCPCMHVLSQLTSISTRKGIKIGETSVTFQTEGN